MKNLRSRKYFTVLTHHNPLISFKNELNRVVQNFHNWLEPFNFPGERFENLIITPAVDIIDENDHFKVEIEMPGMREEDVKISIADGLLIVKGEKATSTSKEDKDKNYMMREISYGNYERRISLSEAADVDKAKASFKKGMLWIDIPKKPESVRKPRILEIEDSS